MAPTLKLTSIRKDGSAPKSPRAPKTPRTPRHSRGASLEQAVKSPLNSSVAIEIDGELAPPQPQLAKRPPRKSVTFDASAGLPGLRTPLSARFAPLDLTQASPAFPGLRTPLLSGLRTPLSGRRTPAHGPATDAGLCLFPTLTDGTFADPAAGRADEPQRIRLQLGDLRDARALSYFCIQRGIKPATLFSAAWAVVLGRYLDTEDPGFLVVDASLGTPHAGVCRIEFNGTHSLADVLELVEAATARSFELHRKEDKAPGLVERYGASFNSIVTLQSPEGKVPAHIVNAVQARENFLNIVVMQTNDECKAALFYRSHFVATEQAHFLAAQLEHVLEETLANPNTLCRDRALISPAHLEKIWTWNRKCPDPIRACVHDEFDKQARLRPQAIAVDAWDGQLTFATLSDYTNRLAHRLVELGVGPEVVVPVCFERSMWIAVAIMAVFKAGGAIVALDAKQPRLRMLDIISRVDAKIILTSRQYSETWSEAAEILPIDQDTITNLPGCGGPPQTDVTPDNVMYLIFTSGSTGTPKGCVIEHASFLVAAEEHIKAFKIDHSTRLLQMTPYTFDVSMLELFTTLTHGICVCIPGEEDAQLGTAHIINRYGITFTFMTPSVVRHLEAESVPGLKAMVLGGEALSGKDIEEWAGRLRLINGYGPTETTISSNFNAGLPTNADPANIGPGVGCLCWVVDANNHDLLVPIGAVGEMLIQGPIVSRGYFADEAKTNEAFIKAPAFLVGHPALLDKRLYKTGDLVRYNSDGSINYIGRKDTQVKLRGQRMELGEIEHHLSQDAAIQQVAVILAKSGKAKEQLTAVFSLKNVGKPDPENKISLITGDQRRQLEAQITKSRERLAKIVPPYMVPQFWSVLEAVPRTVSGKTDRVSLRKWLESISEDDFLTIAGGVKAQAAGKAKTEMETRLQNIWSSVLDVPVEDVAPSLSFINAGGDSITATKVIMRCRAEGLTLTVADILQSTSLAEVARRVKKAQRTTAKAEDSAKQVEALLKGYDLNRLGASNIKEIEDGFACSPMQEGILLGQSKVKGAYEIRQVFQAYSRNDKSLDSQRFRNAWQQVVKRHGILRTVFADDIADDSHFHQVVLRNSAATIEHVSYYGSGAEADIVAYMRALPERQTGTAPPYQMFQCNIADGRVYFMLSINHALIDGGSTETLLGDFALAYDGEMSVSKPPPYKDFVRETSKHKQETLEYWHDYLSGIQPCLVSTHGGNTQAPARFVEMPVDFAEVQELFDFCHHHKVTVANALRAAWGLALRTLTGSDDVCFGYLTSGRDVAVDGIEELIGTCISMLVCRHVFDNHTTVPQLARRTQDDYFEGLPHQHCSLAQIQSGLNLAGIPLFNSIISLQRSVSGNKCSSPSVIFELSGDNDPTDFDVSFGIEVGDSTLSIRMGYWTSSFSVGEAENVCSIFSAAISALIYNETEIAAHVNLFSYRDELLIQDWNEAYPKRMEKTAHELFAEMARVQPNAPAIHSWDGEFTFRQVDDYSNRIAEYLIRLGATPGSLVPFCFDKSAWATISEISIMKAGGAFVGLSPEYPRERLSVIANDCSALMAIVPPQYAQLMEGIVPKVVVIDEQFVQRLPKAGSVKLPAVTPSDPAYASFTSGSTGKPKGILVEHGSLVTSTFASGKAAGFSNTTRSFQFAAYTFDAHISDSIFALLFGGCVCIPSEEERMKDAAGTMNRLRVTWSFLTPKVASSLSPSEVPTLKTAVLGGEAVAIKDVLPWLDACSVKIAYGPTETTISATVSPSLTKSSDPLNLGRGAGCRLWIVNPDDDNMLCPVGTIGELLIEGPLVARGYINEPEKTKAVFIGEPEWYRRYNAPAKSQRFYKTGDLVRYNPDGTINFIGRKDTQVKIRGLRIELGEIEHSIAQNMPSCSHVTVDAVPVNGQPTLVAFMMQETSFPKSAALEILAKPDANTKARFEELEKALALSLPTYMIPSVFFPITRVPMSVAGKVDRKALRAAVLGLSEEALSGFKLLDETKRAPETATEKKLHEIWTEVLAGKTKSIGADDSFFRLGGDSILVMKLSTAARAAGMDISVADIFKYPQLSQMAEIIEASGGRPMVDLTSPIEQFSLLPADVTAEALIGEITSTTDITTAQIADIYPCAPLQEGLASLSTHVEGTSIMRTAFRLRDTIDIAAFKRAWQKLVDSQALLRTRIVNTVSSRHYQVVLHPQHINWNESSSLEEYCAKDDATPMSLGDPFFRYAIVANKNDMSPYFVWTAHHSCYDGWTLGLIFDQLNRIYNEGADPLPEVPYKTFVKYLQSVDAEECKAYWTKQTAGETPASFPRLPSANYQPRTDRQLSHAVKFVRPTESEITTSTIVRSAWATVLARYLDNAEDVLFGQTLAGRNAPVPGIESMHGPAICVVPVTVHLDREQTVADFLKTVQTQTSEMIPYEHYGIQNIRSINAAARAATEYKNVLITQTGDNNLRQTGLLGMEPLDLGKASVETYAVVVECTISNDELNFVVYYDTKVIPTSRLNRLMHHFEQALLFMNSESTMPLKQVDLFSEQDHAQLTKWNGGLPAMENDTIHDVFSCQALRQPDAPAVDSWDAKLTYSELDDLSSRLAQVLSEKAGIKAESIVPLCFDKSAWTIVAQLAVMKAGGACVMLNPEHPIARLRGLIQGTKATLILAAPQHVKLFEGGNEKVLPIDAKIKSNLPPLSASLEQQAAPHNTAIVVFTSGSTGEPKGIVLEHRAICSASKYQGELFGYRRGIRMLQFAHYTFDLSNSEIFYTLMHGGTVCVPSDHDRLNNLHGFINSTKVDTLILTPTVAALLNPSKIPTVKTLTTAGEPADRALQTKWANVTYNIGYGPAETTSFTGRAISRKDQPPNNVGHAAGCRYWIAEIEDDSRLAPIGCVGEILIDGPIVSRGYLNQPDKTAASYIQNPPWLPRKDFETVRVYKSGDLGRLAEDGTLLIVGRKDSQVKIHGQRIELGEIEHNLRVHPEVEAAMVTAPKSGPCKGRLVAAVAFKQFEPQLREGTEIELSADQDFSKVLGTVRQALESALPPYMIPGVWMVMDLVPLTQSRKINRKSINDYILAMDEDVYNQIMNIKTSTVDVPTTELEILLHGMWCEALGLRKDQVGINNAFLGLGGDSISAMQIASRCQTQHNLKVSVKDILQSSTLAALAASASYMDDATQNKQAMDVPPKEFSLLSLDQEGVTSLTSAVSQEMGIDVDNIEDIYPCSPMQEGILLSQARNAGAYDMHLTLEAKTPGKEVDVNRVYEAWQAVVDRHPILRTIFIQNASGDGHFGQMVLKQIPVEAEFVQYDGTDVVEYLQAYEVPQASALVLPHQTTFCLSNERVIMNIKISHALVDGSALDLIANDLVLAYEKRLSSIPAPLYSAFISYLQKQDDEVATPFWNTYLNGIRPCNFPALRKDAPKEPSTVPSHLTVDLSKDFKLQELAKSYGVSVASIFQTAWGLVLRAYTGSNSVNFGYLTSGRDIAVHRIEETLGPLINLLVCRLEFLDTTAFKVAKQVQNDYLESLSHQHTSLAQKRQDLGPAGNVQFNTTMSFQKVIEDGMEHELELDILGMVHPTEWDIAVQVMLGSTKAELSLLYWDTKMTEEQINGVVDTFKVALSALAEQPHISVQELSVPAAHKSADEMDPLVRSLPRELDPAAFWSGQAAKGPVVFPKLPFASYKPQAIKTLREAVAVRKESSIIKTAALLSAAWSSVMTRWSDAEDVVFGLKMPANIASITLPLCASTVQQQPISEVLEEFQVKVATMQLHQSFGLKDIRSLGAKVENICNFKNVAIMSTEENAEADVDEERHNYPLIVQFILGGHPLQVAVHYDELVLTERQVFWMLSHLKNMLTALSYDSTDKSIDEAKLIGEDDYHQLRRWNQSYPEVLDTTVHAMIHEQATRTPEAPAVDAWDGKLTYKQLDSWTDVFAGHLRTLGVGPNVIVSLCFHKSVWVPLVQIGVLKAGGAFLSLNPTQTATRLADQVTGVRAKLIIAAPENVHIFKDLGLQVVQVGDGIEFPEAKKLKQPVDVDPSCPAYLISTSGSTGKPKFPLIEHRAIATSIRHQTTHFGIGKGLRVMQFAALTFDVSIIEIFGTLAHGGTLCIASDEDRMNNLEAAMNALKVEFTHITPTVFGMLDPKKIPSMKAAAVGGEKMTEAVVAAWSNEINLINVYGPTEAAVNCACNPHVTSSKNVGTIGRAVGCRLWITEPEDPTQLTPVGCVGELLIEGPILARGYVNEPEKTAAAFIDTPAWIHEVGGTTYSKKIYRSGDLARYNTDGTIAILGRIDAQMKINGLRIEAGEVEYNIKNRRPQWDEVAVEVVSKSAGGSQKALAAFIEYSKDKGQPMEDGSAHLRLSDAMREDAMALQADLPASMPHYMVPSMWIPLDRMPKTVSGKLDRKILRAMLNESPREVIEHYALAQSSGGGKPATELEITLASLWAKALGVAPDSINQEDSFFQLGGDSVVAMKLVSIGRTAGYKLSVADIFRVPRLKDAALLVKTNVAQDTQVVADLKPFAQLEVPDVEKFLNDVVAPKVKVPRDRILNVLECNDTQNISLASTMTSSRCMLNYYWFEGMGKLDFPRLRDACREWVNRLEVLRSVFMLHRDKFLQVVLSHLEPEVVYVKTANDMTKTLDELYHGDLAKPQPLEASMMKFFVVQDTNSARHRIIVRISHAQYDGLSWPRLIGTLIEAYDGRPSTEPHTFGQYLAESKLEQNDACYEHWRTLLQGSSMREIVERQSSLGGSRRPVNRTTKTIPYEASKLEREGITGATVMKAVWGHLLAQLHGASDITFGHTIAGRNGGATDVVGPCINIIPVRVQFGPETRTVMDLLRAVQQQQVANIPYETLGSRDIIRHCTDWAPSRFFTSIVQHQNIDEYEAFELGGIRYEQGAVAPELEVVDAMGVLSKPRVDKQLDVTLIWSRKVIPERLAAELLTAVCDAVTRFVADPNAPLPPPHFPKALLPIQAPVPLVSEASVDATRFDSSKDPRAPQFRALLADLWAQILYSDPRIPSHDLRDEDRFFDLGADVIQTLQLARHLDDSGIQVRIEDLLHHQTLKSQVGLLCTVVPA